MIMVVIKIMVVMMMMNMKVMRMKEKESREGSDGRTKTDGRKKLPVLVAEENEKLLNRTSISSMRQSHHKKG